MNIVKIQQDAIKALHTKKERIMYGKDKDGFHWLISANYAYRFTKDEFFLNPETFGEPFNIDIILKDVDLLPAVVVHSMGVTNRNGKETRYNTLDNGTTYFVENLKHFDPMAMKNDGWNKPIFIYENPGILRGLILPCKINKKE